MTTTGLSSASYAAEREGPQLHDFNISEPNVAEALNLFAEQTGAVLLFPYDLVEGRPAKPLKGRYDVTEALDILLEGSGLSGSLVEGEVIRISLGDDKTQADREDEMASGKLEKGLLASVAAFVIGGAQAQEIETIDEPEGEEQERQEQDVIIVTGTNIRGVMLESSPSFVFDREAIERTGVSTTEQFIEKLPQNFSGLSETSRFAGSSDNNVGTATGANLRGLGADSTLTLLNGHRLAPGSIGNAVDLSMIPLAIIERVDIITDGASAIYGSDAIGGVVNFTTRQDFEGALTSLRGGTVTDGGHREFIGSQTLGKSFDRGNILAVYEYQNRSSLSGADRAFTETAPQPLDILPQRKRHALFVDGNFKATDKLRLNGHVFYSDRQVEQNLAVIGGSIQFIEADVDQITAAGGAAYDFADTWRMDVQGLFSRSKTVQNNTQDGAGLNTSSNESSVASVDIKLDGSVFSSPGGDVKLAIGGHYRMEEYAFSVERFAPTMSAFSGEPDRDVYAAFAEIFAPIVSEDNRRPGLERLEVNAAVRHEDYSDFGGSTNPKVGALWSPVEGLNLRGTWGTSFRAPLLDELFNLDRNISAVLPSFILAPSPDGTPAPTSVFLFGSNPDLRPEEATTWTAGFDYRPAGFDGLQFSATYYDIDFEERIVNPIPGSASVFAFEDQFAPLIDRSPDLATLEEIAASPFFFNALGLPTSAIMAIVDSRLANYSSTRVTGVDFLASSDFDLGSHRLGLELSGGYIIKFENQLDGGSEPVDEVNTVYRPVGLNLRGGVSWSTGPFGANVFVNYVDSYEDNRPASQGPIDSFTTVDLSLSYNIGETADEGLLEGTSLAFSVNNLFDQDPPFVVGNFSGINYDGTNANPVGRFVSLQIQKEW